jgi:hypothetical protein
MMQFADNNANPCHKSAFTTFVFTAQGRFHAMQQDEEFKHA